MSIVAVRKQDIENIPSSEIAQYLHKQELSQYLLLNDSYRLDWLGGRIALKEALRKQLTFKSKPLSEFRVDNFPTGSPYFPQYPQFYCSISHSFGWAVAAVSAYPVGVDIQKIRRLHPFLLDYVVHKCELDVLTPNDYSNDILISKVWTIKESVLKGMRIGLKISPKQVKIKSINNHLVSVNVAKRVKVKNYQWRCYSSQMEEFFISVATPEHIYENETISWYKPSSILSSKN